MTDIQHVRCLQNLGISANIVLLFLSFLSPKEKTSCSWGFICWHVIWESISESSPLAQLLWNGVEIDPVTKLISVSFSQVHVVGLGVYSGLGPDKCCINFPSFEVGMEYGWRFLQAKWWVLFIMLWFHTEVWLEIGSCQVSLYQRKALLICIHDITRNNWLAWLLWDELEIDPTTELIG